MEILHIPAKSKIKVKLTKKQIKELPERIGVVTTIQFFDQIDDIVEQVGGVKGGQILGCEADAAERIIKKVDGFLYVGTGTFHPIIVYLKTKKQVYCFNPKTKQLSKLKKDIVERFEKKKRTAQIKFLSAKKIGILVSIKPGQKHLDDALELKKKLEKGKNKKECFIFIFDTLDVSELENFNFIQSWVNTACPRLADEKSNIINLEEIKE